MKGKTKMMIAAVVVIIAGIYYYAAIPAININSDSNQRDPADRHLLLRDPSGYQYPFIRDMVFHHDLIGDTGSFVPGKKENEQVRDQRK